MPEEKKLTEEELRERVIAVLVDEAYKHYPIDVQAIVDRLLPLVSDFYRQEGRREVVKLANQMDILCSRVHAEHCPTCDKFYVEFDHRFPEKKSEEKKEA